MRPSNLIIPESIWTLAENAHMKAQLGETLLSGNYTGAIKTVETEGEELAKELNRHRRFSTDPMYAFQALVAVSKDSSEDEWYLYDLQKLYAALIDTFGAPLQIDTG